MQSSVSLYRRLYRGLLKNYQGLMGHPDPVFKALAVDTIHETLSGCPGFESWGPSLSTDTRRSLKSAFRAGTDADVNTLLKIFPYLTKLSHAGNVISQTTYHSDDNVLAKTDQWIANSRVVSKIYHTPRYVQMVDIEQQIESGLHELHKDLESCLSFHMERQQPCDDISNAVIINYVNMYNKAFAHFESQRAQNVGLNVQNIDQVFNRASPYDAAYPLSYGVIFSEIMTRCQLQAHSVNFPGIFLSRISGNHVNDSNAGLHANEKLARSASAPFDFPIEVSVNDVTGIWVGNAFGRMMDNTVITYDSETGTLVAELVTLIGEKDVLEHQSSAFTEKHHSFSSNHTSGVKKSLLWRAQIGSGESVMLTNVDYDGEVIVGDESAVCTVSLIVRDKCDASLPPEDDCHRYMSDGSSLNNPACADPKTTNSNKQTAHFEFRVTTLPWTDLRLGSLSHMAYTMLSHYVRPCDLPDCLYSATKEGVGLITPSLRLLMLENSQYSDVDIQNMLRPMNGYAIVSRLCRNYANMAHSSSSFEDINFNRNYWNMIARYMSDLESSIEENPANRDLSDLLQFVDTVAPFMQEDDDQSKEAFNFDLNE